MMSVIPYLGIIDSSIPKEAKDDWMMVLRKKTLAPGIAAAIKFAT
jgi:hypothetical protein